MKTLKTIALERIDPHDQTYQILLPEDVACLADSIDRIGLINPLLLQARQDLRYRIITGFRRHAALSQLGVDDVPAFIVSDHEPIEMFRMALEDNSSMRTFDAIELSTVIDKLHKSFGLGREEIVSKYLPLLGFGQNAKVYDLYAPLQALDESWQRGLRDNAISVEVASLMAPVSKSDRKAIYSLITTLKLSRNRQREFYHLLRDCSELREMTMGELLSDAEIVSGLNDEKLTVSQKTERIKRILWSWRYPRFTAVNVQFETLIRKANLPPDVKIQPPSYFEGETFKLTMSFKNQKDYCAKMVILAQLSSDGTIEGLADL
jgi:ParB family chromosome partitioning protein